MNKIIVNQLIPLAYDALEDTKITKDGKMDKAFRSQISSFGAAVTMGSMLSAIAFFSEKGSAEVDRTKLMKAILVVLKKSGKANNTNANELYQYIFEAKRKKISEAKLKEDVINAAIAIKLAMNLYVLEEK